ncbi:hypothetical protein NYO98_04165 [Nocardioides sp. STR2]|uniref:Adenylate kinase n=1 Tax=Nocardioides pini TaxID=2975053 RepID=A0ABT4C928_9ACTN|nr:hypothetical protein [Nocardioides pini]MCY4725464.1 hypothetical protein [Nocardioides pini]
MAEPTGGLPDRVLLYGVTGSGKSRRNGNVETWRAMASRDSIIVWHFRSFARKRSRMRAWAASPGGPQVLLFRRPRDLEAWIATLG